MREVVGVVFLITIKLTKGYHHRVKRCLVLYLHRGGLTAVNRDLLVRRGQIALGRLGLAHRVGALGKLKGVGVAMGVRAQHAHGLPSRIEDGELRALKGVAVVTVGDSRVGAGLMQVDVTGEDTPPDAEESRSRLSMGCGNGHAHNSLVTGYGEDADVLAVLVFGRGWLVVVRVIAEARVHADMAAGERQLSGRVDFHRSVVLGVNLSGARDGVVARLEAGDIDALPTHGLIDCLVLVPTAAGVLDCRKRVSWNVAPGVGVLSTGDECLTGPRGALELPRADVVH